MLKNYFNKELNLNRKLNPDEAVAFGATLHAAMNSGEVENVEFKDVIPISLGTIISGPSKELDDRRMSVIFPKNT